MLISQTFKNKIKLKPIFFKKHIKNKKLVFTFSLNCSRLGLSFSIIDFFFAIFVLATRVQPGLCRCLWVVGLLGCRNLSPLLLLYDFYFPQTSTHCIPLPCFQTIIVVTISEIPPSPLSKNDPDFLSLVRFCSFPETVLHSSTLSHHEPTFSPFLSFPKVWSFQPQP